MRIYIVMDSPPYPYAIGGAEIFAHILSNALVQLGHEIHLVSVKFGEKTHVDARDIEILYNRTIINVRGPFLGRTLNYLTLKKRLKDLPPEGDVVFSMMGHSSLLGYLVKKYLRARALALVFAGLDTEILARRVHSLRELLYYLVMTVGLKLGQRENWYIALTEIMRKKLSRFLDNSRIRVIPVGIEDRFFEIKRDEVSGNDILFVGRLEEVKNIRILIKAFERLVRELPEARLIIVGEGSQKRKLKRYIDNKPALKNSILLVGAVPHEQIHEYYKKASVIVMPSKYEGLSLAALQGMASGMPLVAAKVGGLQEIVKHGYNGLLFNPGSVDELFKALTYLLRNKEALLKMGINARKYAYMFKIKNIAKLYEQFARELMTFIEGR